MAGKKLEVGIGADVSDFKKKISEVEFDLKELSKLKIERIKLGLDTSEINRNITDVKKTLRDLKSTTTDAGNSFGNFNKKTADGGAALTAFSRIAQDAPYGIIGVGNNITNTAEQFGALVKQTGSAGGALKALLSSLSGVGGVLLGVSLLTTGLTLLSQSGLTVSDVLDKLTGQYDKFKETITKIRLDSAKQSGEEIANMKALVSVAQDETLSREKRLIAVRELQKEFPAYFGNLKTEQILNGNVTGTVQELTKAIIARAEASAIADEIGKLASKKLDLQIQKEKAILKLKEAQSASENKVTVTGGTLGATGLSEVGQLSSATSRVKDLNQQLYDIQVLQDKLAGRLNQKKKEDILLSQEQVKIQKTKTFNTPQVSKANTGISGGGLIDLTQLEFATGKIDQLGNKLKELPGTISTAFGGVKKAVELSAPGILEALINFNEQASLIINNAIADTFAGIGEALGNAFSTGANVLESVGATLLSALGSVLVSLGKLAIQTGVGLLAVKTALKTLNPAVAIAAGVGLVAIGSAFSAGANKIGGSIGSNGGGGSGVSTRGGSNSSFSSSSGGFSSGGLSGNVVFEISGQKLIGVLNNTLNGNKRLGGAVGLG